MTTKTIMRSKMHIQLNLRKIKMLLGIFIRTVKFTKY